MSTTVQPGLRILWKFYRNYTRDLCLMVVFFLFQHAYEWFAPIFVALLINLAPKIRRTGWP